MSSESSARPRRLGRGLSALLDSTTPVAISSSVESPVSASASPQTVKPDDCIPNKYQPRTNFDDSGLAELADSIRRVGVVQPILVRPRAVGGYEIVAGERRWRAAKLAGLAEIPAIVKALTDGEAAEWAVIENVQREDLNAIERGMAMRGLMDRFGLTQAQVAERVGIDRSTVANLIRLIELEPSIRDMIVSGRLSAGHGKALLMAPAGASRAALAEKAASEEWSVRRIERAAAGLAEGSRQAVKPSKQLSSAQAAAIADLERRLGEHLGTKVSIHTDAQGEKGRVVLEFYGLDHFDGLMSRLGFQSKG
jgi:ParB family chromosome partitioning protein